MITNDLTDFLRDPDGSLSMCRLAALILTLTTVGAVVMGRDAQTIGALVLGGIVSLLTRTKNDAPPSAG